MHVRPLVILAMLAVIIGAIAGVSAYTAHTSSTRQQSHLDCAYAQISDPSVVCK